jgi:pimeloyl-ACP methyl ester carboxylesterase
MKRAALHCALITCLAFTACASAADVPPGMHAGTLEHANYRIDIPEKWNGDLVMLMHGYQPVGAPNATPMEPADATSVFLKEGYAVAQSQFASQGWAVGDAIADNERLREYFEKTYARPSHTYLYGFSLGGLAAAASIERYPHAYTGAMITCGLTVSTPDFLARGVVEPLAAFDALIPGVIPDLGAPGSPPGISPDDIAKAMQAHPEQAALLEKRLQETPETLPPLFALYYMALRELEGRAGGMPVDNRKTDYKGYGDDADLNRRIHRYAGSPGAVSYAKQNVTLTGHVGIPLVMQWNTFDPTIPSRFHGVYPDQVRAAGNGKWLTVLPATGNSHCDFTDADTTAAFNTLVGKAKAPGH